MLKSTIMLGGMLYQTLKYMLVYTRGSSASWFVHTRSGALYLRVSSTAIIIENHVDFVFVGHVAVWVLCSWLGIH